MNKINSNLSKLFRKSVQVSPTQLRETGIQGQWGSTGSLGGVGGGSGASISNSTSTSFNVQYHKLPLIDLDQIFQSFLKDGELVKSYFLVHCILSKKNDKGSANNLLSQQTAKSWQPFFKKNSSPSFLVLCNKVLLLIDASSHPFTLLRRIPIQDIKELSIDSSDVGLFCIKVGGNDQSSSSQQHHRLNSIQTNVLYFSSGSEKRDLVDVLQSTFEEVYKESLISGSLNVKRCNMLSSEEQIKKKELKEQVTKLLDEMSLMGFSAQDLWDGDIDLKLWVGRVKEYIVQANNSDDRYVIEFILPDTIEGGKKIFRVPNNIKVKEILHFLCTRVQTTIQSTNYTLCTIKGKEVEAEDTLADYGLGSFFDNWQLCLMEKGKVKRGGLFEVEVHFPDTPEYSGRHQRIVEVDGYMVSSDVVKSISQKMEINKPHLYAIKIEPPSTLSNDGVTHVHSTPILVGDDEFLSKHGLGSRFRKCKIKLIPKKFPKASNDKQKNINVTQSIIMDTIEQAWIEYNERKIVMREVNCKEIVEMLIETTVQECLRASTLPMRMASLSAVSRAQMYKYLAQKEQEEINYYKVAGQKKIANDSKDLIHGLTVIDGPSTYVDLEQEQDKPLLQTRVPPPPPPPILGFKTFKPKKETTSATPQSPSSITNSQSVSASNLLKTGGGNTNLANQVDMNQILSMRGKLRAMVKTDDTNAESGVNTSSDSILKSVKLRSNQPQIQVTNTKETNELMLRLQKRNQVVQSALADAEELGDS